MAALTPPRGLPRPSRPPGCSAMTTWPGSSRAADGRHALGAASPAGNLGTYSAQPAAYSRAQPLRRHQAPGRVLPGQRLVVAGDGFEPSKATPTGFTAILIGAGRVRVKSSACAGGVLAGLPRPWCGVLGLCGPAGGLDGGGLPVTPAGLWDLSPF